MSLDIGEKQTLSICKKTRRSTWSDASKSARNTDAGMKQVVYIEKDTLGRKISRTVYEK